MNWLEAIGWSVVGILLALVVVTAISAHDENSFKRGD